MLFGVISIALFFISPRAVQAQAGDWANSQPSANNAVLLSPFEVSSTQDKGYTSTNASTGFITNAPLMQIPQAVTLVTRDFIDDTGYLDTAEVLQFAGAVPFARGGGDSISLRGLRIGDTLVDGVPWELPIADNADFDSYTVIRGPTSTLYLNTILGGALLITTKKPLPVPRYTVTGQLGSDGLWRAVTDFTGPLGSIGDMKFSYRLVAVGQSGKYNSFKNTKNDHLGVYPALQMTYKNTIIRLAWDRLYTDSPPNANTFLTPQGQVYVGAGRDQGYYVPNAMEKMNSNMFRFQLLQSFGEHWNLKITAQRFYFQRVGSNVFPSGGVNWPADTVTFTARANDLGENFATVLADIVGKYTLFGMPMETAYGTAYARQVGENWTRATSDFGRQTVSISDPDMDLLQAPAIGAPGGAGGDVGDYPIIAPPSMNTTYRGNAYVQQRVEIVPKHLAVIAGFTYSKILNDNNVTNVTLDDQHKILHRYAVTYNPIEAVTLYAMNATTFSPQTQLDANGNLIGSERGDGREVGIKTGFLNGRISSTLAFFNMTLSNEATFGGVLPNGVSYYQALGTTTQKGFDLDLAITPLPGLQFVGAFYNGTVKNQTGAPVSNTYRQSISFFGRYEVQGGHFRGLSFGGGYARVNGRIISTSGVITGLTPEPAFLTMAAGNNVTLFAVYPVNAHWLLRLNVENVLNETYPVGAQAAWIVDPSPPRTFTLSSTFKF